MNIDDKNILCVLAAQSCVIYQIAQKLGIDNYYTEFLAKQTNQLVDCISDGGK